MKQQFCLINDNVKRNVVNFIQSLPVNHRSPLIIEALENNNTPHRYTIEELEGIRRHYSALRRALIKQREAA